MRALLLLVPVVLVACPSPPCATTCTSGCCSATGECLAGNVVSACGNAGAMCSACGTDKVCSSSQACVDDAYPDVNAFIADFVPALCERLVRCHDMNSQASCEDVVKSRLVSSDGTITGTAIDVLYKDATKAVTKNRATFDGVKGKKCLKAVRQLACEDTTSESIPECDVTFVGKVADAQTCYFDGDCVRASYCSSTGATCPGTCQARKMAGTTASRDRECTEGLYVYGGKCLAKAAAMSSCAAVFPTPDKQQCALGSFCNSSNICAARGTVSATCTADSQCNPSLACSNGTCQTPAALNATCNEPPFSTTYIPCQLDLRCDIPTAGQPGTCKTLAAVSTACWYPTDCATALYCDGARFVPTPAPGTCAAKKAPSATCSGAGQCAGTSYCDFPGTNACVAKKMANAACTALPADQCIDGFACSGGSCKPTACHDPS